MPIALLIKLCFLRGNKNNDKNKKIKLVLILLSAIILIIALISCYYIFPLGYNRKAIYSRSDYEENLTNYHLGLQFSEQNSNNEILKRIKFSSSNSIYELDTFNSNIFSVYQNDVLIGEFFKPNNNIIYRTVFMYELIFYENESLYYLLHTSITKVVPFVHNGYGYTKYTAYSFNLKNGESKSVMLKTFFDKLKILDPKINFIGGGLVEIKN